MRLLAFAVVFLSACGPACRPDQQSLTRCTGPLVEVCAGERWRTVRDCRDVGPAEFVCEEGPVAACLPRGNP